MLDLILIFSKLFFSLQKRQILVVFQNNNELRGGGGFITQTLDISIGRLQLKMRFLHDHNDLYPKIQIDPPKEIKLYLKLKHWFFRDSNIFGDAQKNAEQISRNYQTIYQNHQVAGVVAVNFSMTESLLKILGPITVGDKHFSSDNLFYQLTNSVSNIDNHDVHVHNRNKYRKSILKDLFIKLIKKTITHFWKWPSIYQLTLNSFKNKDLQINFLDHKSQEKLINKGLSENFSSQGFKDFLAIVENNYLGLKTNRYLRRSVYHDVEFYLKPATLNLSFAKVKVKIRTDHFGSFNYPLSGTYQSVTKIFIPKLAKNINILSKDLNVDLQEESDFQTLSFHKIITVGGHSEIVFEYQLPDYLFADNSYSFKYIKQSGVKHEHVFESVIFPDQYQIESNQTAAEIKEGKLFWDQANLNQSYSYKVKSQFHHQSPRIFYHEIVRPELIQIRFNEAVFFTKKSKLSEQLEVTDVQNGKRYKIQKAYFANNNRHLYLEVPELPRQDECFYRVKLNHLQNQVGTLLSNKPREVTVVYRSKYYK